VDNFRIQQLSKQLEHPCLIEQAADLLYLTGLSLSKGRLLVTKTESILYVDGRYFDRAKKEAPCSVLLWDEQKKIPHKQIGFDSATVTYDGYLSLQKNLPHKEWIPIPSPVKNIRLFKDPQEVRALKKAAHLTLRGIQKVIEGLKEGVSEEELALEFEIFCRKEGASGLSFDSIIAFGENSAYPHYRAGKAKLRNNQVVLIDVGAIVDQYHGDMTRTFFFGKPDPEIVRFEQIVREAQKKAIQHVRPGIRLGELDEIVCAEFDKHHVKPLYIHSLGHGIGLETHEYPRIKFDGEDRDLILKPGMVFTIEPGLYKPGLGGIRIEDMILVTETGHENLCVT
jgi:Xaa-Pro aminopeptidase